MSRPPAVPAVDEEHQVALLNTNTKSLNPDWLDPNQPLLIPENPLHYEAYELQQLKDVMKKQAQRNPAQFNSTSYIAVLKRLADLWDMINKGDTEDGSADDTREVADDGDDEAASTMGKRAPAGVGAGISPDNPFTR